MKIDLPPLPYSYTALEPEISKTTLEIHHDKHHAKYVNVANQMIEGTEMEGDDSEALLMKLAAAIGSGRAHAIAISTSTCVLHGHACVR